MGKLRMVLAVAVLVTGWGLIPVVDAQEQDGYDESAAILYRDGPVRKLGRGMANVLTGVVELPLQMERTTRTEGPLAGATVGTLRGAGMAIGRTLAGGFEILTFPLPNPRGSYTPVMQPEYLSLEDLI